MNKNTNLNYKIILLSLCGLLMTSLACEKGCKFANEKFQDTKGEVKDEANF